MYRMHLQISCGLCVTTLVLFFGSVAAAGIVSGTVESNKSGVLVVSISSGKSFTFSVPSSARVMIDGKTAALSALETGARVSVFTDSNDRVTRISARSASATPTPQRPAPKERPSKDSSAKNRVGDAPPLWPQFRGPQRDNISPDEGLLESWPADGPRRLWSVGGLGSGYSSVAIADGLLLTMGTQGNQEAVFAVDLKSHAPRWATPYGDVFQDGTGDGPRGTPTIDGDRVYALGGNGQLVCLSLKDGRPQWSRNILQEFGASNITWGISESVLIDGERLICTPGGRDATLVALDKRSGRTLWQSAVPGGPQAAYSSPIVADVDGVRQYIQFTSRGLVGVRADDGQPLWGDDASSNGTANCSTPLYFDRQVFSASGYGAGGALVKLTSRGGRTTAEQVYKTAAMKNHHGGVVQVDGYIYGSSDPGILTCLEAKTGRVMWQDRSVGKGSLTYADGHLYLRSENGPVALVAASPSGYQEKGRFDQPQRSNRNAWAHPAVADGKLFLRDQDMLLVFDVQK